MSHPDPQQPSVADAARGDVASAPADRPLPGFPQHGLSPHSPIEREIERSERASAALAATRALARASFTDSQLAADDAAAAASDDDIDTSGWIRTEYAALDHTVRSADDEAQAAAPRNLVGGTFNPGIASQHGRAFPGASVGTAAIKTRTGAQARFLQEARQAPRGERAPGAAASGAPARAVGAAGYDRPAVVPMLAPAMAPVRARAATPAHARRHAASGEAFKFVLAAGLGAVVVLIGGGVAWKAGLLTRNSATNAAVITPQVAAQAEAARVLSATPQEIPITPAAGPVPAVDPAPVRSSEEVDAALAAAARAAAVPVASVHAAGPAHAVHPTTPSVAPMAVAPAPVPTTAPAMAPTATPRAAPKAKESVADSIARAQARADSFLATGAAAPAPAASPEVKNER